MTLLRCKKYTLMLLSVVQAERTTAKKRGMYMDKINGSMEALSTLQITADIEGLDAQCKTILRAREVLAVILGETIEEYHGYSRSEIMDFIEERSMNGNTEVSAGRTYTQVHADNPEYVQLNEKVTYFDLVFRAVNPALSDRGAGVCVHIDVEPQKTYRPGYPIEKRGIYYLARMLGSQLSLVTDKTDYGILEKCYSIWICRDDVPLEERYTVSFYKIKNTYNSGACRPAVQNYDLMTLVVIRLGQTEYHGREGDKNYALMRFLNAVMYPHKEDFMDTIQDYIDFSNNKELWREVTQMSGLGQSILEEGRKEGIRAFIMDHVEENIPKEHSLIKLQKHFGLTLEKAEQFYDMYAAAVCMRK